MLVKKMNKKILLGIIPIIILVGIIGLLYPIENTGDEGKNVNTDLILDQQWILQTLTINGQDVTLSNQTSITIQFDDENIAKGSGGCNSFSGEYQILGDYEIKATTIEGVEVQGVGGELTFDAIAQTEMACIEDNIMDQETEFFSSLNQVASFEVMPDTLKMVSDDEQIVLRFVIE